MSLRDHVNRHVWRRLTWRVPIIAVCWALPTWLDVAPEIAEKWQAACVAGLLAVFASWQSSQGRPRKPRPGDGGDA